MKPARKARRGPALLLGVGAAASSALCGLPADAQTAQTAPVGDAKPTETKKPDAETPTITVTGQRPQTKRTPDSVTYDTSDNAQGQAGTAADVLSTVPSVNVSGDGSVTVRGSGNVQVYVNGRPTASMQGDSRSTTLQSMSGSSIAGVEVITTPSAKYDSNGGAIVNLILKKGADPGPHATVTANAGDRGRKNVVVAGSYGAGSLAANLNVSLRDDVRLTRTFGDRRLRSPDGTVIGRNVRVARYTPTHARAFHVDGSLEYKLSPSADLGADFSFERSSPKNRIYEHRIDYDAADTVTAEYDRVRTGVYYNRSSDASVYYQQRGSQTRDSLKVVAQSGRSSVEFDRPFVTTFTVPAAPPTGERIYNRYVTRQQRLAIDYEKPLGRRLRLSLGTELKRTDIRQDNGRASIDPATAGDLSNPPVLYLFDARQTSAAAYATLQAQLGRWTLQAGERGQIVTIDPHLSPSTALLHRRITGANHSLSVTREIGAGQVSAKLNRALQLFDPRDLNPLVTYVDPVNRSVGDPTLLPQKVLSAEAGYGLSKGARDASASFYYKRVDDILVDYNFFIADNVQVGAKQNSGSASSYGVEASLSDALTKTLKYSVTGNLFHSTLPVLDGDGSRQTDRRFSYIVQGSLDWKPNGKNQIHLDGRIQGPTLVPQGVRSGTASLNLVWRHTLSPRLAVSLTAQNIVQRTYVTTRIDAPTAFDVSRSLNGRQAIFVGVKYKLR